MSESTKACVGDDQPRENVSSRFKAMSGSAALRVDVVGRRSVRIEAKSHDEEIRALKLTENICSILRCEYQWERTDTFITVTILETT